VDEALPPLEEEKEVALATGEAEDLATGEAEALATGEAEALATIDAD